MTDWRAETVFCDDVRQEDNGKHILIGVYGGDLVPGMLPSTFPLGCWIRFHGLRAGQHQFEMLLIDPTGKKVGEIKGGTHVKSDDLPTIFAMSGLPMNLDRSGDIVLKFGFDGTEPVEVGRLKVTPPPEPQPDPAQN